MFGRPIWMVFTFFGAIVAANAAQQEDRCERHTIGMLSSSDDEWMAIVNNFVCGDGYFVTVIVDTVQLIRPRQCQQYSAVGTYLRHPPAE